MSMSDPIAPDRLEALLRGEAGADGRERRIGALLDELTAGEIAPSAELRERVRSLTAAPVETASAAGRGRRSLRLRRSRLRRAPVVGLAVTLAVVAGVALSQTGDPSVRTTANTPNLTAASRQLDTGTNFAAARDHAGQAATPAPAQTSKAASVPSPDGRRAQDYTASLRLAVGGVAELSRSTQTVLDTVRSLGGFVESVDYGTPSAGSGSALIDLRIPVGRSQEALRQFSALGTITSQQVQIRDLQSGLDQETNRARALRRRIALLHAKLRSPVLTPEARATLESRLADSQSSLASVLRGVHTTQQRAAFARFSLALVTGSGTAIVPVHRDGAFQRTAADALGVISVAGRGALFAAIVGGPFLLIAGGAWWLARRLRRRAQRRLLESA
ncbi:MAG: hypothetical protein QOI71_2134 [Gaiellales bacterium]|jgi:hypothetical protein|nr:hypothetical protein [Gaiellales bacterium]